MDRTGWIAVICCAIALFGWQWFFAMYGEKRPVRPKAPPAAEQTTPAASTPGAPNAPPAIAAEPDRSLQFAGKARFEFTTLGGGVRIAEVLDEARRKGSAENVHLNEPNPQSLHHPIGALGSGPGNYETLTYQRDDTQSNTQQVVYKATRPDGIVVTKRYILDSTELAGKRKVEEHLLHYELTLSNPTGAPIDPGDLWMYGGTSTPQVPAEGYLMGVFRKSGSDFIYKDVGWFNGNPILFRKDRDVESFQAEKLHWAGVSNQFFTTIVRSHDPLVSDVRVGRFPYVIPGHEAQSHNLHGMEFAFALPKGEIAAGQSQTHNFDIYMGPKEYARLANLPDWQTDSMAYGHVPVMGWFFGWIIKPVAALLVTVMVWLHNHVGDYGVSIILLTLLLRLCIWPIHAKAHKVSKRMSLLTPKIQEIKDKYPEDLQKQQQEQAKLWGEYGINPLGGCLPALFQIPIFLGYFRMLSSAAELRHESFAWVQDLSMPDKVWVIPGLGWDLNLLPIVMTATSYLQFSMMPKTGDKSQRMIFMLMPLMFLVFCYNYASALALYWTCQNIFSIVQTFILNKQPMPVLTKVKGSPRKSWMQKLQEQAEAAQAEANRQKGGGAPSARPKITPSSNGTGGGSSSARRADPPNPFAKKKKTLDRGSRSQKPKNRRKGGR